MLVGRNALAAAALALLSACSVLFDSEPPVSGEPGTDASGSAACVLEEGSWAGRSQLIAQSPAESALRGVPVLVALTGEQVASRGIAPAGQDLRFVDEDGSILPHEIDHWDPDGTSFVWVRLSELRPSPAESRFWLYHNNPEAERSESAAEVWRAYEAVFHLEGQSGTLVDSTGNDFEVPLDPELGFTGGQIGRGLELEPGDPEILAPTLYLAENATLEAWVKLRSCAAPDQFIIRTHNGYGLAARREIQSGLPEIRILVKDPVGADQWHAAAPDQGALPAGVWSYLAGVYDGSRTELQFHLNGAPVGELTSASGSINQADEPLGLGRDLCGVIDEVRISTAASSQDEIAVQHASMTGELVTIGEPETCDTP